MNNVHNWIQPNWPAPSNIKACSTTRQGGVSQSPYDSLNVGDHVDDAIDVVKQNRQILRESLALPSEPVWLTQVHEPHVLNIDDRQQEPSNVRFDASVSHKPKRVCAVMTADCLPVLFCNSQGTSIAAAHAGWRGLHAGVLENTVAAMNSPTTDIMAWLGPAIAASAFEVGDDVRDAFLRSNEASHSAFVALPTDGKWLADIYALARLHLQALGVTQVYGGDYCTFSDSERFFSYRRDGVTGRMVSLIWRD